MNEIATNKMSIFQIFRKAIYLKYGLNDLEKAIEKYYKLPLVLKYDKDIIDALFSKISWAQEIPDNLLLVFKVVPDAINKLDINELKQMMIQKKMGREYITFLSQEKQSEILGSVSIDEMQTFPEQAILAYYKNYGINNEDFNIQEFSPELQLKLILLNNSLIKYVSPEIQQKYINGNNLVGKAMEYGKTIAGYNYRTTKLLDSMDVRALKSSNNHYIYRKRYNNIELFKYCGINEHLNPESVQMISDELYREISKMDHSLELKKMLDEILNSKNGRIEKLLGRFIKVALNEDILRSASIKDIKELIMSNDRSKLLDIIGKVYGDKAKKILEERPNIGIDEIPNLYIFNESIMKEFSFGDIHNFLSYDTNGVNVITDLARYPIKMKQYKIFTQLTNGYFHNTPQDLDKKLIAFADFYELMDNIGELREFSKNQIENLHEMLTDYYHNTLPVTIRNWDELEHYQEIRDNAYQEAMDKINNPKKLNELIIGRFFCSRTDAKQFQLVADYDNLAKNILTEEERDYIRILNLLYGIEDKEVLMDLYQELLENKDLYNKRIFDKINQKIVNHFNTVLTQSLLSPEDMVKKAERGEKGISIREVDGITVIFLEGIDFYAYATDLSSNLSGYDTGYQDYYERWTTFEEGASTISGCLFGVNNIEKMKRKEFWYGLSNFESEQVVGMGYDDIYVTHDKKSLNPKIERPCVLDYPEEITKNDGYIYGEGGTGAKNHPEVAIYRRLIDSKKIKEGSFGGRIMPGYLLGNIKIHDIKKMIPEAKKFGLKYVILANPECYRNNNNKESIVGKTEVKNNATR